VKRLLLLVSLAAGCASEAPAPTPEPTVEPTVEPAGEPEAEPAVDREWDDYQTKQEAVAADLAPAEDSSGDDFDWDAYEAQLDEFDAEADAEADAGDGPDAAGD
jgi:hypothetical protein